ncbi:protein TIFY 9-like [Curcuma longa]|uniref:protein TIFY 9-like n=1 Tax=Curcuma longa TaxID=136217 RepID=UPI003D9E36AD
MMDSYMEHDFLGVDVNGGRPKKPTMEKKNSFREISRMSPEIIRSVMAITSSSSSSPTTRKPNAPPSPLLTSCSSSLNCRSKDDTVRGPVAPFTIFYNGSVLAFNLPHDKAETLLKLVEGEETTAALVDERNN